MVDHTIYFTESESALIDEIQEEIGASSRSEVVRKALKHYRAEIMEEEAGEVPANGD